MFWRWWVVAGMLVSTGVGAQNDTTYWLLLRDGTALAARGAYEVRDRRVLFRGMDGVLAALPLQQVDLEATRAARSRPSPREAMNVSLETASSTIPLSEVGLAGEAAKRAGHKGAFIDLSRIVVPEAEIQEPPAEARPTAATQIRAKAPAPSSADRAPARRPTERLPKIRLKRTAKPPA
jgi:hypothetical protein